jgi:hypothetical protein
MVSTSGAKWRKHPSAQMAAHFRISYGKWRQPCHIGAAQSRLTSPARVSRRQDCDSHQKLVLMRSGALQLAILFEVSYPAPALFNGGRVDGSFRRSADGAAGAEEWRVLAHKRHPAKRKVFSVQDGRESRCAPNFACCLAGSSPGATRAGCRCGLEIDHRSGPFGQPKSREQEKETLKMRIPGPAVDASSLREGYLSSQTSSMRQPLKMLLIMIVCPLT